MSELDVLKAELLPLVRSVVKRGTFTLASGKTSNVYFDAREVTLNARGAYQTARVILAMLKEEKVDAIGGLTLGADPIAGAVAAVSAQAGRPIHGFIVRKEAKAHGMGKVVEGPALPAGARVVVVDDVVTSGGSTLLAVKALREAGFQVVRSICVVDREEGGRATIEGTGIPFSPIFTNRDIL